MPITCHHDHQHLHVHTHATSRRGFLQGSALTLVSALLASCGDNTGSPSGLPILGTAEPSVRDAFPGFEPFRDQIKLMTDGAYLRIESTGIPAHNMMVGIRSWQQQVPLPQPYSGANAWSIPLKPTLAETPISAKDALYRGAIALAVNGVPIFNALNNRGDDAYLAGELDDWGGHAGRADDYHYHMAPLHLQEMVGNDKPIAYALDGFPLYGLTEPDGAAVSGLDEFNGHVDEDGNYHYHASQSYPYINGGLRGVVTVEGDQVEPQPRLTPVRSAQDPLRGAVITGFQTIGRNSYALAYTLNGVQHFVNYQLEGSTYTFEFVDAAGNQRTETYRKD